MDTKALEYLATEDPQGMDGGDTNLYIGPRHVVDDTNNFPSPSAVINESKLKTGVYVPDEHASAFDREWRESLDKGFSVNPEIKRELDSFLQTGLSNGRKLRLQVMVLPPGMCFKIHAHPNIEFELTLSGRLEEFRSLFRVPADEFRGDQLVGPSISSHDVFEHRKVDPGQCMINEIGSIHQSFTGKDEPCSILVLWSGCHANTPPENVNSNDDRLQPTAGW
jgi:hypothetical protein